jgi:hypothetical protein
MTDNTVQLLRTCGRAETDHPGERGFQAGKTWTTPDGESFKVELV